MARAMGCCWWRVYCCVGQGGLELFHQRDAATVDLLELCEDGGGGHFLHTNSKIFRR
jgi:hypothetical protein